MDFNEYLREVDRQIKAKKERERLAAQGDRRQKSEPVAEERRSGQDRRRGRGVLRSILNAAAAPNDCSQDCEQGRKCDCRKSA